MTGGGTDAYAENLAPPTGKALITFDGAIANTNVQGTAQFDRDQLAAMGMTSLSTHTPFEPGLFLFEGVLLRTLLEKVGVTGDTLVMQALDGYQVDVPVTDAENFDVLLAMKKDGKWLRVRDKGPLRIIYPIDAHPELKTETHSGHAIWQLKRISVR